MKRFPWIELVTCCVASFLLAFPAGGFVLGWQLAKVPEGFFAGLLGRVFIGFVFAVLTVAFRGRPPLNEGGGDPQDAWPYIIVAWLCLMVVFSVATIWATRDRVPDEPIVP